MYIKKMGSSFLKNLLLCLPLFLLLSLHYVPSTSSPTSAEAKISSLDYLDDEILTGDIDLAILWYGKIKESQKWSIQNFTESLNNERNVSFVPKVSDWWRMVESYQMVVKNETTKKNGGNKVHNSPTINVKVVSQMSMEDTTVFGTNVNSINFVQEAIYKVTGGKPKLNTVVVIFTDPYVGQFAKECYAHGYIGKQPYIIVVDPNEKTRQNCLWPLHHKEDSGPVGLSLNPPNNDIEADAMIINFAAGLVATVTNPHHTRFVSIGASREMGVEASSACRKVFGSGAFPGYPGRLRVDPVTQVSFNAHGVSHTKFLLPGIWNPKTSQCWTIV